MEVIILSIVIMIIIIIICYNNILINEIDRIQAKLNCIEVDIQLINNRLNVDDEDDEDDEE